VNFLLRLFAPLAVKLGPAIVWLAKFSPYFHLKNKDGSPYMDRYWVIFPRWITGGWGVRVHVIRSSDDDRALHDHPWDFKSIILKDGYWEVFGVYDDWKTAQIISIKLGYQWKFEPQSGKFVVGMYRKAGDVNIADATRVHRIRLHKFNDTEQAATTLFFTGPRKQSWGFMENGVKVPWREYMDRVFGRDRVGATEDALAKAYGGPRPLRSAIFDDAEGRN
jgi:hypothetical protein